ncbi:AAR2 protein-domain-containing protein [Coniella lustricola]|uniref:AAR2 protein-domain-containing protein n=1 Tax=Coniella lustricola TaxID=2025994 RepID=A0A2T3A6G0_9PEZI|nr:AAR2 protein-domain-containing protein [Coniella lustricola]
MAPSTGDPQNQGPDSGLVQSAARSRQESTTRRSNDDHLHPSATTTAKTHTVNENKFAVSPAQSTSSLEVPGLSRTDSTPSLESGCDSLQSHVSIPVVGTFPLGSLRVHKAMDSPRSHPGTSTDEDGSMRPPHAFNIKSSKEMKSGIKGNVQDSNVQTDDPDMPPLEGQATNTHSTVDAYGEDQGDIFLILDLPPAATVGCDSKAIGTGLASTFQGIRDIPPGAHFIWVAEPNTMSRCGYWFVVVSEPHFDPGSKQQSHHSPRRVRVKQWDKFNEVLVDPASSFEARDAQENIATSYPQLTPYGFGRVETRSGRQEQQQRVQHVAAPVAGKNNSSIENEDESHLWTRLTSGISETLLARVTAKSGVSEWLVDTVDCAAGDTSFPQKPTQTYQTLAGNGELNFLFPDSDIDLYATNTAAADAAKNDKDYPFICPPQAAPLSSLPDTSQSILRLVDTPGTGIATTDLVGEMQFTFLTGLHLSNLACIEQWWHLVLKIVLRAHALVVWRPRLALELLATLHAQLVYNERYIGSDSEANFSSHEYGGPAVIDNGNSGHGGNSLASPSSTGILDIIPGNKRRLHNALTVYKRRMNELLLDLPPSSPSSAQQQQCGRDGNREAIIELGRVFMELEAWFWRYGWDLRTDYMGKKLDGSGGIAHGSGHTQAYAYGGADDDDDEYRPVIVDIDEAGREVGLLSFE